MSWKIKKLAGTDGHVLTDAKDDRAFPITDAEKRTIKRCNNAGEVRDTLEPIAKRYKNHKFPDLVTKDCQNIRDSVRGKWKPPPGKTR